MTNPNVSTIRRRNRGLQGTLPTNRGKFRHRAKCHGTHPVASAYGRRKPAATSRIVKLHTSPPHVPTGHHPEARGCEALATLGVVRRAPDSSPVFLLATVPLIHFSTSAS